MAGDLAVHRRIYRQLFYREEFMTINRFLRLLPLVMLTLGFILTGCAGRTPSGSPEPDSTPGATSRPKSYAAPPAMSIDTAKQYTAIIETAKGDLVLELFAKDVPVTVNNFVFLARDGFYDGTIFHRVIPGFMAQGGDPTGTGFGGPGYEFKDEFTTHRHGTGALSMANGGANTNGSQFFITYAPQPHLDGKHSVFGQLTEGMDVLKQITNGDVIRRVSIIEK
jgi:peptidyl-prolyl cis-trans isomerase B (cyclophilin B)